MSTFDDVLQQVLVFLQHEGRLSYRVLKLQFHLDDEHLAALKEELMEARALALDKDDKLLVWVDKSSLAQMSRVESPKAL